jgi:RimJ/RimL family protein N-acetyltransferase
MINLRELHIEDVELMSEFLNDHDISKNFLFTRYPFSKENFIEFVKSSWGDKNNIHFAIIESSTEEYVGTVSLKNINYIDRNAEYAIVTRKKFWGTQCAFEATKQILEYGFNRLNLYKIYLNVLSSNSRAIKFYGKFGFIEENVFKDHVYVNGKFEDLHWYCIFNN